MLDFPVYSDCFVFSGFAFDHSSLSEAECAGDRCSVKFPSGSVPVHLELGQQTHAVLSKLFHDFTVK